MPSFIRTCTLIAMVSSSLACDEGFNFASSELHSSGLSAGASGSSPVIAVPPRLSIIEGLELHALNDPAAAPKHERPLIEGLKVQLKIIVNPVSRPWP